MGKKKVEEIEVRAQFPIKMTADEKALLEQAAAIEDLPTGTWMRRLALREAKRVIANKN